ncbi:hypothetical protein DRJ48_01440 [Candidatus Woesearchaeota archaeon]|nr:SDR family NAD(P)-dependent oxidoreductase [Candidatus Woesearchaeota archaeon]RLE43227.1 MAG: hypothetical protein DRJ48_01440 [Candidatus Woesearchaeota archaeon]
MKKAKTILITGGAGFIGSNLVRGLLSEGYSVNVVDICDIEGSKIEDLKQSIRFFKLDLLQARELEQLMRTLNPDAIIHLAASINLTREAGLVEGMMQSNFQTTLNLYLAAMRLKGLRCVISLGSAEEYGQNHVPFAEYQREMPVSPYSLSKVCITYLSSYFHRIHNLPTIILRPFSVYGEYQTNKQFVPFVISKCLRNEPVELTAGEQTRDFVYVGDLVEAMLMAIENPEDALGEVINICTGREISIREAALVIKRVTGSTSELRFGALPYRSGESMHFFGANKKARLLIGWSPRHTFEQGIKKTVEWYKRAGFS